MTKSSYSGIIKTIGPGILFAGAAIGASHVVMSTQAGGKFGFSLIWLIVLVNLFKYPFFEFAYRYTSATGKSVLDGYQKLGYWAIGLFFLLSLLTGVVNFAAVTIVTAGLTEYFFQLKINTFYTSILILISVLLLMFVGKFALLDKIMKIMVLVLTFATITAFIVAFNKGSQAQPGYIPPSLWETGSIAFLIAFMGWMPTPIEASVWPSLWTLERTKQTGYTPTMRETMIDFHIGYIISGVLAIFFLGLGAYVIFGTGVEFSANGLEFSKQLVSMYTNTLGDWSHAMIAAVVMITMFSTAITVIDGYPRSLEGSLTSMFPALEKKSKIIYWFWILLLSTLAAAIIGSFTDSMKALLNFATIASFMAAPIFAFINYKVVTSKFMPVEQRPGLWLIILSWAGIVFLTGFCVLFIASKFW